MKQIEKYNSALSNLPESGGGGLHSALLGVATHGIQSGLTDNQIFQDLRATITGTRRVPDSEITASINRARQDTVSFDQLPTDYKPQPAPRPPQPKIQKRYLDVLIERGKGIEEVDLWEASPIRLLDEPKGDAELLLKTLYPCDAHLFIGDRYSKTVRTQSEWCEHISTCGLGGLPHMIFNPLSGAQHPDKSGNPSFRCDAAVAGYWYCIAEFDNLPRAEQLAFWGTVPLPITVLIDSGGKSIHGILRVDGVFDEDDWQRVVRDGLYRDVLIPLGVDPACANPSRLSRLPGHQRDGGRLQKLLYLNPHPSSRPIIETGIE